MQLLAGLPVKLLIAQVIGQGRGGVFLGQQDELVLRGLALLSGAVRPAELKDRLRRAPAPPPA